MSETTLKSIDSGFEFVDIDLMKEKKKKYLLTWIDALSVMVVGFVTVYGLFFTFFKLVIAIYYCIMAILIVAYLAFLV